MITKMTGDSDCVSQESRSALGYISAQDDANEHATVGGMSGVLVHGFGDV